MTKKKISCNSCIHQKVCAIYVSALKWDKECLCKLPARKMSDVCGQYINIDELSLFSAGE